MLRIPDPNAANRLRGDVPDYPLNSGNVGNLVVSNAGELKSSRGKDFFSRGKPLKKIASLLRGH